MGLLDKFRGGLEKTHQRLVHEIRRIVTLSPKLTPESLEEIEAALMSADLGAAISSRFRSRFRATPSPSPRFRTWPALAKPRTSIRSTDRVPGFVRGAARAAPHSGIPFP